MEIEYKFPFRHRLRPERLWVSTPLRPDSVDASMSTTIDTAYIRTHCCLPDNSPKQGYTSPNDPQVFLFICSLFSIHTTYYYLFHKRRGIRQGTPVRSLGPERN
jgi:hypothetical protein